MKNIIQSIFVALSMYSAIPMPQFEWNSKNMRYALCFFPLVGLITGALFIGWNFLSAWLGLNVLLFSCVAALIPVIVTGGIHVDGYCDTVDALSSWKPPEQRLEIMKDPNIGAFALIWAIVYFVAAVGLWSEFDGKLSSAAVIAFGYIASRALSGISIVSFKCAKTSGLASMFSDNAQRHNVRIILICLFALCCIGMVISDLVMGIAASLVCLAVFFGYRRMAYKKFGGITGDLAGYFLQVCELCVLAVTVIAGLFL